MRNDRRWNQEQLAAEAGVSKTTVYNAEAAKEHFEVNRKTLDRLSHAFGIPISELIMGADGTEISWEYTFDSHGGYKEPPVYVPAKETEPPVRSLNAGIGSLNAVIEWFKALPLEDRRAVVNSLDAYTENLLGRAAQVVHANAAPRGSESRTPKPKDSHKAAS